MDRSQAPARRSRALLAPAPEGLEARRLLASKAAMITINEGQSQGAPTLLILGTSKADVINITDNGTGAAGNITVQLGNGGVYVSKTAISEVEVMTLGGGDRVSYNLTGDLTAGRTVLVQYGRGANQFSGTITGNINNPAGLDLEVYGGAGSNNLTINQTGVVQQGVFIPFLNGGAGTNTLTYKGTGGISANATITPALKGGRGTNTIVSNYSGIINGNYIYNLSAEGGPGSNTITDDIAVGPGSTGSVGSGSSNPAVVRAGNGHNTIHYAIAVDPTATQAVVNAAIDGTHGQNTVEHTANVLADGKFKSNTVIAA